MADVMMRGGDTTNEDGEGGVCIYGRQFDDEGIWYPHSHRGVISMATLAKNTNRSQFFITLGAMPQMNG